MTKDEESAFLFQDCDTNEPTPPVSRHGKTKFFTPLRVYLVILHVVLVFVLGVLLSTRRSLHGLRPNGQPPAYEAIKYKVKSEHGLDPHSYSNYSGPPTYEQDRAWDYLIRPVFFKASREELERAGESVESSIELVGGGYAATLGVHHELHCLRQPRLYLYKDRYFPTLTEAQANYLGSSFSEASNEILLEVGMRKLEGDLRLELIQDDFIGSRSLLS
ncbi:hypothetical protein FHL15_003506 [Xylaria flabelliformis]|uniref:Uncharacterized protein n=1 Tax=Xylaria flabelliformis TaxID=2512241 RepID=A0A553I5R7_9PEZI|nr:hypothetical protein FHL15_003506 [Xylaria flabelliformis]